MESDIREPLNIGSSEMVSINRLTKIIEISKIVKKYKGIIHCDGSPYYSLLFNETMSMGKRIAREIKNATASNELDKITT